MPIVDSIPLRIDITVILLTCAVFGAIGNKNFTHRALDWPENNGRDEAVRRYPQW